VAHIQKQGRIWQVCVKELDHAQKGWEKGGEVNQKVSSEGSGGKGSAYGGKVRGGATADMHIADLC